MSILKKLSTLGAASMLAASIMAVPAVAQHSDGFTKASVQQVSKFKGNRRGNFRSNRNSFRGNRGNFRGNRNNFRGNSFRGNKFRGNSFQRNRFNNGFRRNNFRGNNFRGNNFRRNNFRSNNFRRNNFGNRVIISSPSYAVGGFYGVTNNTVFISDFGVHGLYAPPSGHHWVCDKGSKDALLVAIATGAVIAIAADTLLNPY